MSQLFDITLKRSALQRQEIPLTVEAVHDCDTPPSVNFTYHHFVTDKHKDIYNTAKSLSSVTSTVNTRRPIGKIAKYERLENLCHISKEILRLSTVRIQSNMAGYMDNVCYTLHEGKQRK